MKELIRTNDPVRLSWSMAVLEDAGIGAIIFDANASIVEGSISAIERRIMVSDADLDQARRVLEQAGDGRR